MIDVVNAALCAVVFYLCFCRLVHTNASVHWLYRFSVSLMAGVVAGAGVAPLAWQISATATQLAILAAVLMWQIAASPAWRRGPPAGL